MMIIVRMTGLSTLPHRECGARNVANIVIEGVYGFNRYIDVDVHFRNVNPARSCLRPQGNAERGRAAAS